MSEMLFQEFLVEEKKAPIVGTQRIYKFENGLGASVITDPDERARNKGLWELAVIKWVGDQWDINYNTPITSDVLRYLSGWELEHQLLKISKLEEGLY